AHDGFEIVTSRIRTRKLATLLWLIALVRLSRIALRKNDYNCDGVTAQPSGAGALSWEIIESLRRHPPSISPCKRDLLQSFFPCPAAPRSARPKFSKA